MAKAFGEVVGFLSERRISPKSGGSIKLSVFAAKGVRGGMESIGVTIHAVGQKYFSPKSFFEIWAVRMIEVKVKTKARSLGGQRAVCERSWESRYV
jgi:hypothetical protein